MQKILVAGPWVGEFGYELFEWQGVLRCLAVKENYDNVVIAGKPGHQCLYADFATDYVAINRETDVNMAIGRNNNSGLDADEYGRELFSALPYSRYVSPLDMLREEPQAYVLFGREQEDAGYDVILHARRIAISETGIETKFQRNKEAKRKMARNWQDNKWTALGEKLHAQGLRLASIGMPAAALRVAHSDDLRGIPLHELANVLRSSKIIAGPSSGPMHFATLCGCTQVVWGSRNQYHDLKKRYEHMWNPFSTGVRFITTDAAWNPAVRNVFTTITATLNGETSHV